VTRHRRPWAAAARPHALVPGAPSSSARRDQASPPPSCGYAPTGPPIPLFTRVPPTTKGAPPDVVAPVSSPPPLLPRSASLAVPPLTVDRSSTPASTPRPLLTACQAAIAVVAASWSAPPPRVLRSISPLLLTSPPCTVLQELTDVAADPFSGEDTAVHHHTELTSPPRRRATSPVSPRHSRVAQRVPRSMLML
jgi:hypothetical protein